MISRSKELEDVGRVASSFPTYLGKTEATLLAAYHESGVKPVLNKRALYAIFIEFLTEIISF